MRQARVRSSGSGRRVQQGRAADSRYRCRGGTRSRPVSPATPRSMPRTHGWHTDSTAEGSTSRGPVWMSNRGIRRTHLLKRSEEHTSELQSQSNLVCRLLLEKKKKKKKNNNVATLQRSLPHDLYTADTRSRAQTELRWDTDLDKSVLI